MSDHRRVVVHEIKLTLGTKLLLAGVVAGLFLHALVPLLRPDPARAQQGRGDTISMSCAGQGISAMTALAINMDCSGKLK